MTEYGLITESGVFLSYKGITIPLIEHMFLKGSISDKQLKKDKDAGARIGAANWTIPGFMNIPYLIKIIDENLDSAAIDTEFLQRFLTNNEKEVNALFTSMSRTLIRSTGVPLMK